MRRKLNQWKKIRSMEENQINGRKSEQWEKIRTMEENKIKERKEGNSF